MLHEVRAELVRADKIVYSATSPAADTARTRIERTSHSSGYATSSTAYAVHARVVSSSFRASR